MVNNMNKNKSKQVTLESRNNEDQQNVSNIDKYRTSWRLRSTASPVTKKYLRSQFKRPWPNSNSRADSTAVHTAPIRWAASTVHALSPTMTEPRLSPPNRLQDAGLTFPHHPDLHQVVKLTNTKAANLITETWKAE